MNRNEDVPGNALESRQAYLRMMMRLAEGLGRFGVFGGRGFGRGVERDANKSVSGKCAAGWGGAVRSPPHSLLDQGRRGRSHTPSFLIVLRVEGSCGKWPELRKVTLSKLSRRACIRRHRRWKKCTKFTYKAGRGC